ncbi:MAG TPA: SDR family NAD(P)-dependent oxidoreductase [Ramlibacter sp.]|jgi:NAD(P)-dependent dehydrogenase (short-subunit alcohol dehydrogenase family)|nr:SDR family NAD(P)-dependent oxidoreductase [Ramlibacter sp.]
MARHLTIVTGASRGMGQAIAAQLIEAGHEVLGISRKTSPELKCEQWPQDLARADVAAARLETWLEDKASQGWDSVTLINNAALLPKVGPLGNLGLQELSDAIRVDLEAPLLLTSSFLRATQSWKAQRKVLNISSGLGRRAMASQTLYCAAKAGMDHFTRCVALEEAQRPNGAKVCSLAPGVIDTDMQVQLRTSDPSQFPDIGYFTGIKQQGVLVSPEDAAKKVIAYLARSDFGTNAIGDIRD